MIKNMPQIRKQFFYQKLYKILLLILCFISCSVSAFVDSPLVMPDEEEKQEITAYSENHENKKKDISSLFYAYIIIPAKWVDNVVTEVISIVIPIKGVSATVTTNPPKKTIQEEVMEALRGSEENIRVKNREAYIDGYATALNAGAAWEKAAAEQMQDLDLQRMIQNAMGIVTVQQQDPEFQKFLQQQAQTRQELQAEAQLLNLFNTHSEQIKEYYKSNPAQLKKIFEQIISSGLAQELKDKAQTMLEFLNTNPGNINPQEMMELIDKSIKNGGATLVICQTICTGLGTLAVGTSTSGTLLLTGFGASLAECGALCANLGGVTAAVTAAVGNMYLREGSGSADNPRIINPSKAESKTWKELKPYRKEIKTNGLSGNKEKYYEWDKLHNDIEVYDHNKKHLGTMNPTTGEMYKDPVLGRKLEL